MPETYCGKSCEVCSLKQSGSCPGCRLGPGSIVSGDCAIAKCCRNKGHEQCTGCTKQSRCATLEQREGMIARRQRQADAEAARLAQLAINAPLLGKWLSMLFWLVIPLVISNVLSRFSWGNLSVTGQLLSLVCGIAGGYFLLQLSSVNSHYRISGWCAIVSSVLLSGANALYCVEPTSVWILSMLLPGVVALLVGTYQEFLAHALALDGVDGALSDKWIKLWKWVIRVIYALIGSYILMYFLELLGLLVMIAGAVMILVVEIKKYIYLYQMAELFQAYSPGENP